MPSPRTWDEFVSKHTYGHFLQTGHWAAVKGRGAWSHEIVALENGHGMPTAGASILYRNLPFGAGCLAYVPRGPVVDWSDPTETNAVLTVARAAARNRGAIALLVEPSLEDTSESADMLGNQGLTRADFIIQPPRTILVDIADSDEQKLLTRMHQKTRYNINLSTRKGVAVREGKPADLERFYAVYEATSERKTFGIHSKEYYEHFLNVCAWGDKPTSALFLAEHASAPGEVLAAIVVAATAGVATYLYGASGNTLRNLMPTYALQWAGIRWARSRGCHTYDLWGIPDEDAVTLEAQYETRTDGLWGVYRTKRGYGGEVRRYAGVWVQVLSPVRWRLFEFARKRRRLQVG